MVEQLAKELVHNLLPVLRADALTDLLHAVPGLVHDLRHLFERGLVVTRAHPADGLDHCLPRQQPHQGHPPRQGRQG